MAQGELGVLEEQAHVDAANEELGLLALKLDPEALRRHPVQPPTSLQQAQSMNPFQEQGVPSLRDKCC